MDWLKGMNNVVGYIEKNLTQPIEYESLARIIGCSVYEFSRIFSFISGMSVSEYIRRRRLSQAVFDIQNGGEKIIDIALKYCYDSPAAFTRAFKELHGTAPLSVRKTNVSLKNYPAIKFVLSIKGVNEMKFKIVEKPAFSVVGVKFTYMDNDGPETTIVADFLKNLSKETIEKLLSLADEPFNGFIGIYPRYHLGSNDYIFAVISSKKTPEEFVKFNIPASKWAILPKDENASNRHERFYTEWLPSSGYKRAGRRFPTVCFYQGMDIPKKENPDAFCDEYWFPVESSADAENKRKEAESELKKIETSTPRNKPVDIDLRTMIPDERAAKNGLALHYTDDGLMVIHTHSGNGLVGTPQKFTAPIKIELRAKTDGTNLRLYYGEDNSGKTHPSGWIIFNDMVEGIRYSDPKGILWVSDILCRNEHWYHGVGEIPINEFVDIEWILGDKVMAVKVNGEVRFASCEYEYIEALKNGAVISSPVYPAAGRGSTITVEKLRITEL